MGNRVVTGKEASGSILVSINISYVILNNEIFINIIKKIVIITNYLYNVDVIHIRGKYNLKTKSWYTYVFIELILQQFFTPQFEIKT